MRASVKATTLLTLCLLLLDQDPLKVQAQSCYLNIQRYLDPKKEPLVLAVKRGKPTRIALPDVENKEGVIKLASGQELLLACTGSQNVQRTSRSQVASVKCENGNLRFEGSDVDVSAASTGCTKSTAASSLKVTSESCGVKSFRGVVLELGFELKDKTWFSVVELCHNVEDSVTWYAAHTVHGHSLPGAIKSKDRKAFTRGSRQLYRNVNIDQMYTRANQEKAFNQLLGPSESKLYVNEKSFLSRGHLAADADFIYRTGAQLTYYFVNVAPQCQSFNQRNWLVVENTIRDLAIQYDEDLNVWTGSYGVLRLADEQGDEQMIYLEPNNNLIPLPEVFWKVVQRPGSKSCTVVVGHNNVYLSDPPSLLCTTIDPQGWPDLRQVNKGYTYYCDLKSFRKVVSYVPNIACQSVLEFP